MGRDVPLKGNKKWRVYFLEKPVTGFAGMGKPKKGYFT